MRSSSAANVVSGWKLSNAFRTAERAFRYAERRPGGADGAKNPPFVDHHYRLERGCGHLRCHVGKR